MDKQADGKITKRLRTIARDFPEKKSGQVHRYQEQQT